VRATFYENFAVFPEAQRRGLLRDQHLLEAIDPYREQLRCFEETQGSTLDRMSRADLQTYLVELLMKQDQMSMAASIESRVPFLDHKLVEFASTLPDAWKLNGWTTKHILRESMKGLLPESILNRPKMGFPVPFAQWTRGAWNGVAREVLLDRRSLERGIIDPPAVAALLRDHAAGRTDGGDRIWSLLNLELWHRTFIDQEGIQTLPHAHSLAEVGSAAAA
jgi:asparagine synthase (glutamine-hydrolysing)